MRHTLIAIHQRAYNSRLSRIFGMLGAFFLAYTAASVAIDTGGIFWYVATIVTFIAGIHIAVRAIRG
jgi:hypothetical protein